MKEQPKIKVGEIKESLRKNRELSTEGYPMGGKESWGDYDSPLDDQSGKGFSMARTFSATLPEEYKNKSEREPVLKQYIEATLSTIEAPQGRTAVELGGSCSTLFQGFSKDFFRRTVGVCLEDARTPEQRADDEAHHHSVVTGNIMDPSYPKENLTLRSVIKSLDSGRIDLMICRMSGPLDDISRNEAIMDRIIRNWYELLNENGLIFVQFDRASSDPHKQLREEVQKWAESIRERFPQINISVGNGAMRLHKSNGAPGHLPPANQLFS